MNTLVDWTREFHGESVMIVKGDYAGYEGTWEKATGYVESRGAVCEIDVEQFDDVLEFTSDFFRFKDSFVQEKRARD